MGDTNLDTIAATTVTGAVTGDVTGDVTGNLTSGAVNFTKVARTATGDGTGTGAIAAAGLIQFVTVTSGSANDEISLPPPVPGTIILLAVGANGYELISSAPATVLIGAGAGGATVESAMAAQGLGVIVCTSATTWLGWDINATTLAGIEAAAV